MKRSEMLTIIRSAFDDCLEIPNESYIAINDYPEYILDIIEKAGMLPPRGIKMEQQDILDRWSISTGKSEYVRVFTNVWDKE